MIMAVPAFNTRPSQVVEAEILHRYDSPVTSSSTANKDFFLVLSVGHCKFHLFVPLIEHLLQAIIGGFSTAFRVV